MLTAHRSINSSQKNRYKTAVQATQSNDQLMDGPIDVADCLGQRKSRNHYMKTAVMASIEKPPRTMATAQAAKQDKGEGETDL